MGEALLSPVFTFGYLCLFLVIASALRSKLSFLQKAFIPSSILAGFLLLLLGPGVLGLINIPEGQLESLVYVLLTILFIVLGLRGFSSPLKGREVAAQTALLTTLLAFLGVLGMAFAFLLVLFRLDLFAGFGSLLMLGYGFDRLQPCSLPVLGRTGLYRRNRDCLLFCGVRFSDRLYFSSSYF